MNRLINIPGVAPSAILATCAWISLNPYFVWGYSRHLIIAAGFSCLAALAAYMLGDRPRRAEFVPMAVLAVFVIYITALPNLDGQITKWVYVLPTILALFVFSDQRRAETIQLFAAIFAASLVPAIVVSLWCIIGLPVSFDTTSHANPVMAAEGAGYMALPGALLAMGNALALPWGGTLYRICGIYDEPGMVGTIGALLLASNRFRINSPVFAVIFLGGVLSFSVAFVVLTGVGLLIRAVIKHSAKSLVPLTMVAAAGLLAVGAVQFSTPTNGPATQLRQTEHIDNRSLPEMDSLISEFWKSEPQVLMFGMGADASVVRGGVSQVVDRVYTDFGLIGFALYVTAFTALIGAMALKGPERRWVVLFGILFALSAYQRPVIWLPYTLLILTCGAANVGRARSGQSETI